MFYLTTHSTHLIIMDLFIIFRILKVLCKGLRLCEHFDYHQLARNTPGFVGADLVALAREAAMTAVNR